MLPRPVGISAGKKVWSSSSPQLLPRCSPLQPATRRSAESSSSAICTTIKQHRLLSRLRIDHIYSPLSTTCYAAKTTGWNRSLPGAPANGRALRSNFTTFAQSIRTLSTHIPARNGVVHAVTRCAFVGKPRSAQAEEERLQQFAGTGAAPATVGEEVGQQRQGFPSTSEIGAWVDVMLQNGEAGEDALLIQKMKGEGDIIFGVADGVGGWSENGIDPALFSQSLVFHAANYAKRFYASPDRLDEEDFDSARSPSVSPSASALSPSSSSLASSQTSSTVHSPLPTPPPSPTSDKVTSAEAGSPSDILQHAFQKTLEQEEVPAGSATACILTFDSSNGIIRSANLGDSGFLVLRPGGGHNDDKLDTDPTTSGIPTVVHQSKAQTHGFNTPLQLSKLPPEFRFDGSIDSKPSHADLWSGQVLDGDIVLVATDGFWDNVSVGEVQQLVKFIKDKHHIAFVDRMLDISHNILAEEEDLANVLAQNLLSYALMCQFSANKTSPFEREAARHGIRYPGGKVDDIAIIVSLIIER